MYGFAGSNQIQTHYPQPCVPRRGGGRSLLAQDRGVEAPEPPPFRARLPDERQNPSNSKANGHRVNRSRHQRRAELSDAGLPGLCRAGPADQVRKRGRPTRNLRWCLPPGHSRAGQGDARGRSEAPTRSRRPRVGDAARDTARRNRDEVGCGPGGGKPGPSGSLSLIHI